MAQRSTAARSVRCSQRCALAVDSPGVHLLEKKFSQEQIESLVAYMRHFKQEETKPEKK
jgi:hypothetical protein